MAEPNRMNRFLGKVTIFLSLLLFTFAVPGGKAPFLPVVQPPSAMAGESAKATGKEKWNDMVAAAKKEGVVMVYSSPSGGSTRKLVPKIKKSFGIDMEVITAPTNALVQKLLSERQRGLYLADVLIAGPSNLITIAETLSPLPEAIILPEANDLKAWPDGRLPFVDKQRTGIALTGAYWSYVLVNTNMVKQGELKSYTDLVQPKWKGKIIMYDPTVPGIGQNYVGFMLRVMGPEKGEEFLRQLTTQDLMITRDNQIPTDWVARGKYPIAIGPSMGAVTPLLKAGAPISWIRMREGGLVHPAGSVFGLINKAPHPHAAKVLLNWLLTAEGQYDFSQVFGQPATRLGVSSEGIDPFTVYRPGEKALWVDAKFMEEELSKKGIETSKAIFGRLVK